MPAPPDRRWRETLVTIGEQSSGDHQGPRSPGVVARRLALHSRCFRRARKRIAATRSPLAAPRILLLLRSPDTLPASAYHLTSAFDKALPKRIAEAAGFPGWRVLHPGSDPPNAPLFGHPRQSAGQPLTPANGSFAKSRTPPASADGIAHYPPSIPSAPGSSRTAERNRFLG